MNGQEVLVREQLADGDYLVCNVYDCLLENDETYVLADKSYYFVVDQVFPTPPVEKISDEVVVLDAQRKELEEAKHQLEEDLNLIQARLDDFTQLASPYGQLASFYQLIEEEITTIVYFSERLYPKIISFESVDTSKLFMSADSRCWFSYEPELDFDYNFVPVFLFITEDEAKAWLQDWILSRPLSDFNTLKRYYIDLAQSLDLHVDEEYKKSYLASALETLKQLKVDDFKKYERLERDLAGFIHD